MKLPIVLVTLATSALLIGKSHAGGLHVCDTNADCSAEATCKDNLCKCQDGHTLTTDGKKCVALVKSYYDSCDVSEQCETISGFVECNNKLCTCRSDAVYFRGTCIKAAYNGDECATSDDCFDGLEYNSRVCTAGKCVCAEGYYDRGGIDCRRKFSDSNSCALDLDCDSDDLICTSGKCVDKTEPPLMDYQNDSADNDADELESVEGDRALNNPCAANSDCTAAFTYCSPFFKTCACKHGYYPNKNVCKPELGIKCTSAIPDCPAGAVCTNGICDCKVLNNYDVKNQKCRKSTSQALECSSDDTCRLLRSNYFCNKETKKCSCLTGYDIDTKTMTCKRSCLHDNDCKTPINSVCSAESKCVCGPQYGLLGDTCHPKIQGKCSSTGDCTTMIAESHCENERCTCNEGYAEYEYECYPMRELHEECVNNGQCAHKSEAVCAADMRCTCNEGFRNIQGNCLRIATNVGDYCTSPQVCMENTQCEKSKCTCVKGWKVSGDRLKCYEPTDSAAVITHSSFGTIIMLVIVLVVTLEF